jgi:hypothetical protein
MKSFYLILGLVLILLSLVLKAEAGESGRDNGNHPGPRYAAVELLSPADSAAVTAHQPVTFFWSSTHVDTAQQPASLVVGSMPDGWVSDDDAIWEESGDGGRGHEHHDPLLCAKHQRPFTYTLYVWGHNAHIKISKLDDTSYTLKRVRKLEEGKTYQWMVAVKPKNSKGKLVYSQKFSFTVGAPAPGMAVAMFNAAEFQLGQNYPNPFNPTTTLTFHLPVTSTVTMTVTNILGQTVREFYRNATIDEGTTEVRFDASDLPSGIYFARMRAEGIDGKTYTDTRKMMLTR